MKINECIQFVNFFDLLTPKEKKSYKRLNNRHLLGVNFGVNLGQFGNDLTQNEPKASTFIVNLTHYITISNTIIYKRFLNFWRQLASIDVIQIDAV